MNRSNHMQLLTLAPVLAGAAVLSGCLLGYPARTSVSSRTLASRDPTATNQVETIVERTTIRNCRMLWTPDGLHKIVPWSIATDYVLSRADGTEAALTFAGESWVQILPVPSTNLWVAIERPVRHGKREDIKLNVLVFQDDDLVRKRSLTVAWPTDEHFAGCIDFSPARWVVRYPGEQGELQYDILRDRFIFPLEPWAVDEGEALLGRRSDPSQ